MADQQTNPQRKPGSPRTYHEIAQGMSSFFPGQPKQEPEEDPEPEEERDASDVEGLDNEYPEDEDMEEEDISEDEDAEPDGEEPSNAFRLSLTVNGEEHIVEDEEEARSLAMRGMHYTQEMQALREEQRKWEGEKQEITAAMHTEKQQYAAALATLEQTFGGVLGDEPDWTALYQENPEQYAHVRAQWDQLHAIRGERERISREQQEEQQKKSVQWMQDQASALQSKKPEWMDAATKQEDFAMIRDYANSIGVRDEELQNLYDHRFWLVLHDAARYRKASFSGKKQAKAAKAQSKKTASPGTGGERTTTGNRRYRKAREKLRDTGDLRAAGDLFQQVLEKGGNSGR